MTSIGERFFPNVKCYLVSTVQLSRVMAMVLSAMRVVFYMSRQLCRELVDFCSALNILVVVVHVYN